jgi:hypothetical protein
MHLITCAKYCRHSVLISSNITPLSNHPLSNHHNIQQTHHLPPKHHIFIQPNTSIHSITMSVTLTPRDVELLLAALQSTKTEFAVHISRSPPRDCVSVTDTAPDRLRQVCQSGQPQEQAHGPGHMDRCQEEVECHEEQWCRWYVILLSWPRPTWY